MQKKEIPQMNKTHYKSFNIAGFQYYQGCEVFGDLKVGTRLDLVLDRENRYDPEAVAIRYGDRFLGYVPRSCNHDIFTMLEMGFDNIYEVIVCRLQPEAHPEHQVEVSVFIKRQDPE